MSASAIVTDIASVAPGVRLRFAPKPDKGPGPLRDGAVDLEIGTAGSYAPEVLSRFMFRDRFVGVAREGHPLLVAPVTPSRYAACHHVVASRRGVWRGPVDDALAALDLRREIVAIVQSFFDALTIASRSDLIALVPHLCTRICGWEAQGLEVFALPVTTPELTISAMWHPRLDADLGHRWLRDRLLTICRDRIQA